MYTDPSLSLEERVTRLEEMLASFLSGAARAVDLVDVNLAAGIASTLHEEELETA